jgi:hypothetical protein
VKRKKLKLVLGSKCRVLAFLAASVLVGLSFLHANHYLPPLTITAEVDCVSLTNRLTGEELKPVYKFQTAEETTALYIVKGNQIWASSFYPCCSPPVTVEQVQEPGDVVTVTAYSYLFSDYDIVPMIATEVHEHDHRDFKPNFVIPPDRNRRRLETFAFLGQRLWV